MKRFFIRLGRSISRRVSIAASFTPCWRQASLNHRFHAALNRHTDNFAHVQWLGVPIWQNVLDLWTIQETIFELKPRLLVECGTNRGGSSYFYGQLFDLMGQGHVVTIDVEKLHELAHRRVTYLVGDSASPEIAERVYQMAEDADGPIMLILDSDHRQEHVSRELEVYHRLVTPGSCILVQDGVIDVLPMFARGRPGPLRAVESFLREHKEFELDQRRCDRFLITHHPKGWLRRRSDDETAGHQTRGGQLAGREVLPRPAA